MMEKETCLDLIELGDKVLPDLSQAEALEGIANHEIEGGLEGLTENESLGNRKEGMMKGVVKGIGEAEEEDGRRRQRSGERGIGC